MEGDPSIIAIQEGVPLPYPNGQITGSLPQKTKKQSSFAMRNKE
jgi:hypothetical protein